MKSFIFFVPFVPLHSYSYSRSSSFGLIKFSGRHFPASGRSLAELDFKSRRTESGLSPKRLATCIVRATNLAEPTKMANGEYATRLTANENHQAEYHVSRSLDQINRPTESARAERQSFISQGAASLAKLHRASPSFASFGVSVNVRWWSD